jgi:hypothetical protein
MNFAASFTIVAVKFARVTRSCERCGAANVGAFDFTEVRISPSGASSFEVSQCVPCSRIIVDSIQERALAGKVDLKIFLCGAAATLL